LLDNSAALIRQRPRIAQMILKEIERTSGGTVLPQFVVNARTI
jgi:hypothetical protein